MWAFFFGSYFLTLSKSIYYLRYLKYGFYNIRDILYLKYWFLMLTNRQNGKKLASNIKRTSLQKSLIPLIHSPKTFVIYNIRNH